MTALTPSTEQLMNDAIEELVSDWKGHDEEFFQTSGERVVRWHVAKIRSYLSWSGRAEIRAHEKEFRERFCAAANIKLRRLQEGLATYKKFYKAGDGVGETANRIWLDAGGWSKAVALAAPKEKEETAAVEPLKCNGRCPVCCKHEDGATGL
jgi:hypothetical protein